MTVFDPLERFGVFSSNHKFLFEVQVLRGNPCLVLCFRYYRVTTDPSTSTETSSRTSTVCLGSKVVDLSHIDDYGTIEPCVTDLLNPDSKGQILKSKFSESYFSFLFYYLNFVRS